MNLDFTSLSRYPAPIRLGTFFLTLLLIWLPLAVPIYWLIDDSNLRSLLTMPLLYGEFVLLLRFWGKQVYRQPQILKRYGLERTRRNGRELLKGLSIGLLLTLSLFALEGFLGWFIWQRPTLFLPKLIVEGLLVALGLGLTEELLFRGWLLDELQRDYLPTTVLWASSFVYALLHFIKPWAEILRIWSGFPGLLLLGLTLVWAKRSCSGRIGLPIGLHAGLVWGYYIINVGQLVRFSGHVPDWITGVDRNPLAGIMGLTFLGAIAFWMKRQSIQNSKSKIQNS